MNIYRNITAYIVKISPIMIPCVSTFLVAKYTCRNNRPLDKLEIAYNRIYFPLYVWVNDKSCSEIDHEEFQKKVNKLFMKYRKYVSQSTLDTFVLYKNAYEDKKNIKVTYKNFKDNLQNYNSSIRYKLGYPHTNRIESYRYLDKEIKQIIRAITSYIVAYLLAVIYEKTKNDIVLYTAAFPMLYFIYIFLFRIIINKIVTFTSKVIKILFQ